MKLVSLLFLTLVISFGCARSQKKPEAETKAATPEVSKKEEGTKDEDAGKKAEVIKDTLIITKLGKNLKTTNGTTKDVAIRDIVAAKLYDSEGKSKDVTGTVVCDTESGEKITLTVGKVKQELVVGHNNDFVQDANGQDMNKSKDCDAIVNDETNVKLGTKNQKVYLSIKNNAVVKVEVK